MRLPRPEPRRATSPGRPAIACQLSAEQLTEIRRLALGASLGEDQVSMSLALRQYVESAGAPEWLRAWARGRYSKCYLPPSLREALRVDPRVVASLTAPGRERLKYEAYAPGTLRTVIDLDTGAARLAHPGEAEVWDDATVNAIFWVDGAFAEEAAARGDRCAQRWGCVVGRWQLLLGSDVRTDYVPGWQWVIRGRASYQQTDPLSAWGAVWGQVGKPEVLVHERGVWESDRIVEVLRIWRVGRQVSYHPRTKLVESVFNRLWTRLGALPASVGRGRGENEEGDRLLRQCRMGSVDPREVCLSIGEMDRRMLGAVAGHNAEAVESRHYGRWVPRELWEAEAESHRQALEQGGPQSWAALPERRVLKVRRGGMVQCQVDTGWGYAEVVAFGGAELWRHEGREVAVYFDPAVHEPAVIVDVKTGAVLDQAALPLAGDGRAGAQLRRMQARSVRREARVLRPDGTLAAWRSEVRDANGRQATRAMSADGGRDRGRQSDSMPRPARVDRAEATPCSLDRRLEAVDEAELDAFLEAASLGLT